MAFAKVPDDATTTTTTITTTTFAFPQNKLIYNLKLFK
jgi:hypothetical protein